MGIIKKMFITLQHRKKLSLTQKFTAIKKITLMALTVLTLNANAV